MYFGKGACCIIVSQGWSVRMNKASDNRKREKLYPEDKWASGDGVGNVGNEQKWPTREGKFFSHKLLFSEFA